MTKICIFAFLVFKIAFLYLLYVKISPSLVAGYVAVLVVALPTVFVVSRRLRKRATGALDELRAAIRSAEGLPKPWSKYFFVELRDARLCLAAAEEAFVDSVWICAIDHAKKGMEHIDAVKDASGRFVEYQKNLRKGPGIKTVQYGTGLSGMGDGLLDRIMPESFLSDPALRELTETDRMAYEASHDTDQQLP